jgi:hypothetical protein
MPGIEQMTEDRGQMTEDRFQKAIYFLPVMPDLIPVEVGICDRHPESYGFETALDSPSTELRVVSPATSLRTVSLSNHRLRRNGPHGILDYEKEYNHNLLTG